MCGSEINDEQECVSSLEVYSISENFQKLLSMKLIL